MERLADSLEDGVLRLAATSVIEPESRVQQEFVRELLVGHATWKGSVCSSASSSTPSAPSTSMMPGRQGARHAVSIELGERCRTGNL